MDRILNVVLFGAVLLLVFALIAARNRRDSSTAVAHEASQQAGPNPFPDPQWYLDRYGQPSDVMEGTINLEGGQIRVRLLRYATEGVQITVTRIVGMGQQHQWEVNGFSELSGPEFPVATAIDATRFSERMNQRATRVLAESQGE